jgi:hypothetical protein
MRKVKQTRVFARQMACAALRAESGPWSNPIHPSGTPCFSVTTSIFASFANLSATRQSTGKCSFTPLSFAFCTSRPTIFAPSSSNNDLPICTPSITFLNVKAMPPPMIISSTLSSKLSIS